MVADILRNVGRLTDRLEDSRRMEYKGTNCETDFDKIYGHEYNLFLNGGKENCFVKLHRQNIKTDPHVSDRSSILLFIFV
jgi:hypothetical protein